MKKYNILTVTPFFTPDVGGIVNHVFNLDANLNKMSHVNSIMTPKHIGSKTSIIIDISISRHYYAYIL